jgi:rhodanese-related sulfurtransferase
MRPAEGAVDRHPHRDPLQPADEPFLLDVRTPAEHAEVHIAGAILVPYPELRDRADELPTDKDEPLWVYCRTDRRSQIAAEELISMGHTDVRVLKGGILAWEAAGNPVVR